MDAIALINKFGGLITAAATVALVGVTGVLAWYTARLVSASSQPHVVIYFRSSPWSVNLIEAVVKNSGSGVAYEAEVVFDPEIRLKNDTAAKNVGRWVISVLAPGETVVSFLGNYSDFDQKKFGVSIKWRRRALIGRVEGNKYYLDLNDLEGMVRLGAFDPATQIAQDLKKIREAFQPLLRGHKTLRVDTTNLAERLHIQRKHGRQRRRQVAQTRPVSNSSEKDEN